MSEVLPVRGSIISSSPCSLKDASSILRKFLDSETGPGVGLLRGYLESVSGALQEVVSKYTPTNEHPVQDAKTDHKTAKVEKLRKKRLDAETLEPEVDITVNGTKKEFKLKRKFREDSKEKYEEEIPNEKPKREKGDKYSRELGAKLEVRENIEIQAEQQRAVLVDPGTIARESKVDSNPSDFRHKKRKRHLDVADTGRAESSLGGEDFESERSKQNSRERSSVEGEAHHSERSKRKRVYSLSETNGLPPTVQVDSPKEVFHSEKTSKSKHRAMSFVDEPAVDQTIRPIGGTQSEEEILPKKKKRRKDRE